MKILFDVTLINTVIPVITPQSISLKSYLASNHFFSGYVDIGSNCWERTADDCGHLHDDYH